MWVLLTHTRAVSKLQKNWSAQRLPIGSHKPSALRRYARSRPNTAHATPPHSDDWGYRQTRCHAATNPDARSPLTQSLLRPPDIETCPASNSEPHHLPLVPTADTTSSASLQSLALTAHSAGCNRCAAPTMTAGHMAKIAAQQRLTAVDADQLRLLSAGDHRKCASIKRYWSLSAHVDAFLADAHVCLVKYIKTKL